MTTTEQKIEYLQGWAFDNHARLDLEGEVGFGRECVGIVKDGFYPSYSMYDPQTYETTYRLEEAEPPEGVTDAYHKHECLAVLGRGDDAIDQLYRWVKSLERNEVGIEVRERKATDLIDLAINGPNAMVLAKKVESTVREGHR